MATPAERLQAFMIALGTEREGALAQLDTLFHPDVYYRDPLRSLRGVTEFRQTFLRMFRKYSFVELTEFQSWGDEASFSLEYTMRMKMAVGPVFSLKMATMCRSRDGRIYEYVDPFDMASAVLSPTPRLQRAYHRAAVRLFL